MSLLDYIPKDDKWIDKFCNKLGTEYIMDYYHRVWVRLYDMQSGEVFDIEKRVKPENRDLFVKVASLCISEFRDHDRGWYFSDDGSKIECI